MTKTKTKARKQTPTKLSDLRADPKNARRHTPRNVGTIVSSLKLVGAARSIVIDERGRVLAGNATRDAAAKAGIKRLKVVDADGEELIAVRRRGLTEEQKVQLAIADNRATDLSSFDGDLVRAFVKEGIDLSAFFHEPELADLDGEKKPRAGKTDPDAVPRKRRTSIRAGHLFALGDHRLLCGDSTKAEDVARVMGGEHAKIIFTDPPYNVSYQDNESQESLRARNRRTDGLVVKNDSMTDAEFDEFLDRVFEAWPMAKGGTYYLFAPPGCTETQFRNALDRSDYSLRQCIVWVKDRFVFGRQDYHWRHESILYGWREGSSHYFVDDRTKDTVWEFSRPAASDDHPTMKPTDLVVRGLSNSSKPSNVVFDGFCGSGTTLIASEQLDRRCHAIEIEPAYCQVIIDRWEAFTGRKTKKLGEIRAKRQRRTAS